MIKDIEIVELKNFTATLKNKFNLDYSNYAQASFKRRLIRILELYKYDSLEQLTNSVLLNEITAKDIVSEITVNTTEMFRDPSMWEALKGHISMLASDRPKIRIWHAGCSSGEEVYSMAILLKELGIYEKSSITATDISDEIIAKAKQGIYSLRNMEVNEENYKRYGGTKTFDDYYQPEGPNAKMDDSLLEAVSFKQHNMAHNTNAFLKFDLILCRNVMIYFNSELQEQVYQLFHNSLNNRGILIIGAKESIIWNSKAKCYDPLDEEEKIYQKINE